MIIITDWNKVLPFNIYFSMQGTLSTHVVGVDEHILLPFTGNTLSSGEGHFLKHLSPVINPCSCFPC
jgi:hypothetical protein